jgi:cobalt-zinc-cadmium efflux system protein
LGLRSVLFAVELGIGLTSHSLSIIAGSGHLFLDLITVGLTLFAVWILQCRSTLDYQKISAWIGLGNGMSLGLISLLIIWEAIEHLYTPEIVWGLSMLMGALLNLIVSGSIVYLLQEHSHSDLNLREVFLHGLADLSSSIALLIAAVTVYYFNWLWADATASLLVACLIGFNAILLTKISLKSLI